MFRKLSPLFLFRISDGQLPSAVRVRYLHQKTLTEPVHETGILISLREKMGALTETLQAFKECKVNLTHIESHPVTNRNGCRKFFIQYQEECSGQQMKNLMKLLQQRTDGFEIVNVDKITSDRRVQTSIAAEEIDHPLWFPKRISDIDLFANRILSYGEELDADHPGFKDEEYRTRRKVFADIAFNYKHGEKIPTIKYTDQENDVWRKIYLKFRQLHPMYACEEYNRAFFHLEEKCGFSPDKIPQLQDVSEFLKDCTGFTIRPVAGLLSSRDFLAGLAFRVFHSTQYIRHHADPYYTPEPDICHELLGHAPLFANPDFARFSQEFGMISLGASDEIIKKLASLYWFTIEFGLCLENNHVKAYGAGLLSSLGEIEHAFSDKAKIVPFDADVACITEYPLSIFQPKYFLVKSFDDARNKLLDWAVKYSDRPYQVRFNPYTQKIEVLDNMDSLRQFSSEIKDNFSRFTDAIGKISGN